MKRLFKVCHNGSNKAVNNQYFDNKMEAKSVRDKLGGSNKGLRVSIGPDHIGKHGHKGVPRMRRQPK